MLDESCRNDVEDEPELELEDNPGTTYRLEIFCLARIFPILGQMGLLTTGPLRSMPVFFAELAS